MAWIAAIIDGAFRELKIKYQISVAKKEVTQKYTAGDIFTFELVPAKYAFILL